MALHTYYFPSTWRACPSSKRKPTSSRSITRVHSDDCRRVLAEEAGNARVVVLQTACLRVSSLRATWSARVRKGTFDFGLQHGGQVSRATAGRCPVDEGITSSDGWLRLLSRPIAREEIPAPTRSSNKSHVFVTVGHFAPFSGSQSMLALPIFPLEWQGEMQYGRHSASP